MAEKAIISKYTALRIINEVPYTPRRNNYFKTIYCCTKVEWYKNGKVTYYCHQLNCNVCNSIKSAKMINDYQSSLEKLNDLQFLTLTVKTVQKRQLPDRLLEISKVVRLISKNARKQKILLSGLRKLEIVIASKKKYHAHLHILIEGFETTLWYKKQWLAQWKKRYPQETLTTFSNQKIIKVKDTKIALQELAKYMAKPPDRQDQKNSKGEYITVSSEQKDWIYQCVEGKKTYMPFGKLRKRDNPESNYNRLDNIKKPIRLEGTIYKWKKDNWYSSDGQPMGRAEIVKLKKEYSSEIAETELHNQDWTEKFDSHSNEIIELKKRKL